MKEKISVLQAISAFLIFMAYFLPWVQISIFEEESTVSLFNVIMQITSMTSDAADFSNNALEMNMSKLANYSYLLYLILVFAFVNAVIQWGQNSPRCAFYFNLIPLGICISLIAAAQNYKIDLFEIAGFGFFISLFASVISVFAAWTNIGRNYNNGYKQYMKVVTYCQLISVVIYIIVEMIPERYYLEFPGTEIDFNPILAVMWVSFLFIILSVIHLPFLVYGWMVVMVSGTKGGKLNETKEVSAATENTAQDETQHHPCPKCGRMMDDEWKVCPYCGHNPEDEKKLQQEKYNLRYAPPGYREDS